MKPFSSLMSGSADAQAQGIRGLLWNALLQAILRTWPKDVRSCCGNPAMCSPGMCCGHFVHTQPEVECLINLPAAVSERRDLFVLLMRRPGWPVLVCCL